MCVCVHVRERVHVRACVLGAWGAHPVAPPRLWQVGSLSCSGNQLPRTALRGALRQRALSQVLKRGVCWGRGLC